MGVLAAAGLWAMAWDEHEDATALVEELQLTLDFERRERAEAERDLRNSAELGQLLLAQNEELEAALEQMEQERDASGSPGAVSRPSSNEGVREVAPRITQAKGRKDGQSLANSGVDGTDSESDVASAWASRSTRSPASSWKSDDIGQKLYEELLHQHQALEEDHRRLQVKLQQHRALEREVRDLRDEKAAWQTSQQAVPAQAHRDSSRSPQRRKNWSPMASDGSHGPSSEEEGGEPLRRRAEELEVRCDRAEDEVHCLEAQRAEMKKRFEEVMLAEQRVQFMLEEEQSLRAEKEEVLSEALQREVHLCEALEALRSSAAVESYADEEAAETLSRDSSTRTSVHSAITRRMSLADEVEWASRCSQIEDELAALRMSHSHLQAEAIGLRRLVEDDQAETPRSTPGSGTPAGRRSQAAVQWWERHAQELSAQLEEVRTENRLEEAKLGQTIVEEKKISFNAHLRAERAEQLHDVCKQELAVSNEARLVAERRCEDIKRQLQRNAEDVSELAGLSSRVMRLEQEHRQQLFKSQTDANFNLCGLQGKRTSRGVPETIHEARTDQAGWVSWWARVWGEAIQEFTCGSAQRPCEPLSAAAGMAQRHAHQSFTPPVAIPPVSPSVCHRSSSKSPRDLT